MKHQKRLTDEDRDRLRELKDEMQEIMGKYVRDITQGPYDPVAQARWRINDGMHLFLETTEPV